MKRSVSAALRMTIAGASAAALFASMVLAASSHHTDGIITNGHNAGTHAYNPGHLRVKLGSPHAGTISDGGRFHDSCDKPRTSFEHPVCEPAYSGNDYSLDIAAAGGTATKLYLGYDGWGTDPDPRIDTDEDLWIEAKVVGQWGTGDCQRQQIAVLATYTGVGEANPYEDLVLGYVWLWHQDSWDYGLNDPIPTNATTSFPSGGTGTIHYINGRDVANVYNDTSQSGCSTGSHTHFEVYSNHAWGGQREWHSDSGCNDCAWGDGYSGLEGYANHIHDDGVSHWTGADYTSSGRDSVGAGFGTNDVNVLGQMGGGSSGFWMRDNPNEADH